MNTVLFIVLCVFALYGAFNAVYELLFRGIKPKYDSVHIFKTMIIDDFDKAEAYIRYCSAKGERDENIVILCRKDDCETEKEAYILSNQFDFVTVLNKDEYIWVINKALER